MMKRIENEDTGNRIKFKATESKIVIFSETQKIIAEGTFPSEKIEVFEKRVTKGIDDFLNEQLLSDSDAFTEAVEIFSEIFVQGVKRVKYKEMNENLDEEYCHSELEFLIGFKWFNEDLESIDIETQNGKMKLTYKKKWKLKPLKQGLFFMKFLKSCWF